MSCLKRCGVCFESYGIEGEHIPRILQCHHTVCHRCIVELSKETLVLRCPECRHRHRLQNSPTQFPQNMYILELLEKERVESPKAVTTQKSLTVEGKKSIKLDYSWTQSQLRECLYFCIWLIVNLLEYFSCFKHIHPSKCGGRGRSGRTPICTETGGGYLETSNIWHVRGTGSEYDKSQRIRIKFHRSCVGRKEENSNVVHVCMLWIHNFGVGIFFYCLWCKRFREAPTNSYDTTSYF